MKIVKFYSPTCGPCKVVEKKLQDAKIEHININILELDTIEGIDCDVDLIEHFNITSVPTILLLDADNKELLRIKGIPSEEELKKLLNEIN